MPALACSAQERAGQRGVPLSGSMAECYGTCFWHPEGTLTGVAAGLGSGEESRSSSLKINQALAETYRQRVDLMIGRFVRPSTGYRQASMEGANPPREICPTQNRRPWM